MGEPASWHLTQLEEGDSVFMTLIEIVASIKLSNVQKLIGAAGEVGRMGSDLSGGVRAQEAQTSWAAWHPEAGLVGLPWPSPESHWISTWSFILFLQSLPSLHLVIQPPTGPHLVVPPETIPQLLLSRRSMP